MDEEIKSTLEPGFFPFRTEGYFKDYYITHMGNYYAGPWKTNMVASAKLYYEVNRLLIWYDTMWGCSCLSIGI